MFNKVSVTIEEQCKEYYCHTVIHGIPKNKPHIHFIIALLGYDRPLNVGYTKWVDGRSVEREKTIEFYRIEVN